MRAPPATSPFPPRGGAAASPPALLLLLLPPLLLVLLNAHPSAAMMMGRPPPTATAVECPPNQRRECELLEGVTSYVYPDPCNDCYLPQCDESYQPHPCTAVTPVAYEAPDFWMQPKCQPDVRTCPDGVTTRQQDPFRGCGYDPCPCDCPDGTVGHASPMKPLSCDDPICPTLRAAVPLDASAPEEAESEPAPQPQLLLGPPLVEMTECDCPDGTKAPAPRDQGCDGACSDTKVCECGDVTGGGGFTVHVTAQDDCRDACPPPCDAIECDDGALLVQNPFKCEVEGDVGCPCHCPQDGSFVGYAPPERPTDCSGPYGECLVDCPPCDDGTVYEVPHGVSCDGLCRDHDGADAVQQQQELIAAPPPAALCDAVPFTCPDGTAGRTDPYTCIPVPCLCQCPDDTVGVASTDDPTDCSDACATAEVAPPPPRTGPLPVYQPVRTEYCECPEGGPVLKVEAGTECDTVCPVACMCDDGDVHYDLPAGTDCGEVCGMWCTCPDGKTRVAVTQREGCGDDVLEAKCPRGTAPGCNDDEMICPDGTNVVGRDPKNGCEWFPCPPEEGEGEGEAEERHEPCSTLDGGLRGLCEKYCVENDCEGAVRLRGLRRKGGGNTRGQNTAKACKRIGSVFKEKTGMDLDCGKV